MDGTGIDHACLMRELKKFGGRGEIRIGELGRSVLGREIPIITVGRGKRGALYVGAHHGMEGITAGVLLDFILEYLSLLSADGECYGQSVRAWESEVCIHIVPMLNPDGVNYALHGVERSNPLRERVLQMNGERGEDFSHWQANARGVDLNHNYNSGFWAYKSLEQQAGIMNGAPTRYSGERPESEPETAALCRFLRFHRDSIAGVLTLHTQGEEIYCSCADKLSAKTMAAGRALAYATGYRLARPEGLAAFGGLTDWCIGDLGRPCYTLECGKGENPLPPQHRGSIYQTLRQSLFCFPFWV